MGSRAGAGSEPLGMSPSAGCRRFKDEMKCLRATAGAPQVQYKDPELSIPRISRIGQFMSSDPYYCNVVPRRWREALSFVLNYGIIAGGNIPKGYRSRASFCLPQCVSLREELTPGLAAFNCSLTQCAPPWWSRSARRQQHGFDSGLPFRDLLFGRCRSDIFRGSLRVTSWRRGAGKDRRTVAARRARAARRYFSAVQSR